jgi:hypothetical protein
MFFHIYIYIYIVKRFKYSLFMLYYVHNLNDTIICICPNFVLFLLALGKVEWRMRWNC